MPSLLVTALAVTFLVSPANLHADAWSIVITRRPAEAQVRPAPEMTARLRDGCLRSFDEVDTIAGVQAMFEHDSLYLDVLAPIFRDLADYMPESDLRTTLTTDAWWLIPPPRPNLLVEVVEPLTSWGGLGALFVLDRPAAIRTLICTLRKRDRHETGHETGQALPAGFSLRLEPIARPLARDERGLFVPLLIELPPDLPMATTFAALAGTTETDLAFAAGTLIGSSRVFAESPPPSLDQLIEWTAIGFTALILLIPALCAWGAGRVGRARSALADPPGGFLDGLSSGVARSPSY